MSLGPREGSLEAPTRHPLDWQNADFYQEESLYKELGRVFNICHGCRRCVSLCNSFPTLFDLVDASQTMEMDGVARQDYWQVVDHCYLCDLCYMTKCPYVPPHEWNVDFPHLMLRAKAVRFKNKGARFSRKILSSTDTVGKLAGIPMLAKTINLANRSKPLRKMMEIGLGIDSKAWIPDYHSRTLRRRIAKDSISKSNSDVGTDTPENARTKGKLVLFTTCYGNYNEPQLGEDLIAVFQHNGIPIVITEKERCCGMPKLELGDLDAVAKAKEVNIPILLNWVDQGWDIVAPIPSCVLMFKQELPLMFPDDRDVLKVCSAIYDPFEYLMLRHRDGKLNLDFKHPLGKIAYHVACHLRVQNIGMKTRDLLQLIPGTEVIPIQRCSGHDGSYGIKKETHAIAMKIGRPVVQRIEQAQADYYCSDCPMAGHHLENGLKKGDKPQHPLTLLRKAYAL